MIDLYIIYEMGNRKDKLIRAAGSGMVPRDGESCGSEAEVVGPVGFLAVHRWLMVLAKEIIEKIEK